MSKANDKEAQKLINFLRERQAELGKNAFLVEHTELEGIVEKEDGKYNPARIEGILRSNLRKAGFSFALKPNGYFFTLSVQRQGKKMATKVEEAIEVKDLGEDTGQKTMTDFHTTYIAPKIFNDIKTLVAHGHQLLIVGPPGCGKSRVLEELARIMGLHGIRRQMSQVFDPEQLVGGLQVTKDPDGGDFNVTRFVPGSLTQAVQNGWFFIGDEYDNATPECNEALKTITEKGGRMVIETEHGVEIVPKHKSFRICFTANTWGRGDASGDFPNAYRQNSASLDRITAFIEMDYDPDVERAIMESFGIENHVIELFYGVPGSDDPAKKGLIPKFRTAIDKNEIQGELGMRKIIDFCQVYPLLGWHKAMLYTVFNKFDKGDHPILNEVIRASMKEDMVPTNDASKIEAADAQLRKYKLKGLI